MTISCSCDMETYDLYVEHERRARKEHCCDDCGGTIRPGERYRYHGGLFDDTWSMSKRCADCQFMIHEVGRTFLAHCGGWSCIYCGDLPFSWDALADGLLYDGDDHRPQMRRVVAMQHALCEARQGTRRWDLPFGEDDDG